MRSSIIHARELNAPLRNLTVQCFRKIDLSLTCGVDVTCNVTPHRASHRRFITRYLKDRKYLFADMGLTTFVARRIVRVLSFSSFSLARSLLSLSLSEEKEWARSLRNIDRDDCVVSYFPAKRRTWIRVGRFRYRLLGETERNLHSWQCVPTGKVVSRSFRRTVLFSEITENTRRASKQIYDRTLGAINFAFRI